MTVIPPVPSRGRFSADTCTPSGPVPARSMRPALFGGSGAARRGVRPALPGAARHRSCRENRRHAGARRQGRCAAQLECRWGSALSRFLMGVARSKADPSLRSEGRDRQACSDAILQHAQDTRPLHCRVGVKRFVVYCGRSAPLPHLPQCAGGVRHLAATRHAHPNVIHQPASCRSSKGVPAAGQLCSTRRARPAVGSRAGSTRWAV